MHGYVLLVESLLDKQIQLYLEGETGPQIRLHILIQMGVVRYCVYLKLFRVVCIR